MMKGVIPSIIFGSFFLIVFMILTLAVFGGDDIQNKIRDGLTDDNHVSEENREG